MKKIVSLPGFLLLLGGLACSQNVVPAGKPASPEVIIERPQVPAKAAWETEWERVLAEAKREGKVSVYSTGGGGLRDALIKSIKDKYGLNVEWTTGRGAEISQKLLTERRAGIYIADVYLGGNTTLTTELKPAQVLEPLESSLLLPEVLDPKGWWGGALIFSDKDKQILAVAAYPSGDFVINSNLVRESEVASYRDMLNPKWKGKIIISDPTLAGAGLGWFAAVAYKLMDADFMRELAKMEPAIVRDERQLVEWVAQGKFAIGLGPKPNVVITFQKAGAPIKDLYTKEGGYLSSGDGNIALVNRGPHPNAARVFLNWMLSKEGGTVYSRVMGTQSGREDVPTDHLEASQVRQRGVKYFSIIDEDYLKQRPQQALLAKEIFGPIMK